MSDVIGRGVAFPLRTDVRGGLSLVGGLNDIDEAVGLVIATAPGERVMRPEFGCGIHDLVFDTIDATTIGRIDAAIRAALDRWEPRIEVLGVGFDTESVAAGMLNIRIEYRVLETSDVRNLVHPFYIVPEE